MHLLSLVVYIPAIVGILTVGFMAWMRKAGEGTLCFSALCFLGAAWLFMQYAAQVVGINDYRLGLTLLRIAVLLSNFVVLLLLLFVIDFLGLRRAFAVPLIIFAAVPAAIFALFSFMPYMIQEVEFSSTGIAVKEAGILYFMQLVGSAFYLLISLVILFFNTLKLSRIRRAANYLLLIALGQAVFFSIITSTIFASSAIWQNSIPLSILFMVVIIFFAIIRHRLFDIRPVIARLMAYAVSLAAVAAMYGLIILISSHLFFDFHLTWGMQLYICTATAIIAVSFSRIKAFFDKLSNGIFYQDSYDTQEFVSKLNKQLVSTIDVEELLRASARIIDDQLKPTFCIFVLNATKYLPSRSIGDSNKKFGEKELQALMRAIILIDERVVVADNIENGSPLLRSLLRESDIAVLSRLASSLSDTPEGTGCLVLGHKKSGNAYSARDAEVIRIISNELVIAVENALRFEEIEKFNATLQEKIDTATIKLRRTNDKLKQLDETKDEFISMASHQLRTPLTSVKGYLSMVLDGDAGSVTPMQRKLLDQAFISSQRMVFLIADLLNVSRLRTGKFVIEAAPTNLAEVVEQEVAQLQETAQGRNLTMRYERPTSFPKLVLDETKIRQVVMNFIDNAIYYTPAGGTITIRLHETEHSVEFTVTDDGIGVPKHEQHHLFNKFYRAVNARKARPDGTGLGLFMAKKIIVAQGGAIIFKSREGKGSTFGFTFAKAKLRSQEP